MIQQIIGKGRLVSKLGKGYRVSEITPYFTPNVLLLRGGIDG